MWAGGDIVKMSLSCIDEAQISPGCVLCHSHPTLPLPKVRCKFEARILVMERLAMPIIRGSQVLLHMHHSLDVSAVLSRLISSERRGEATPRLNPRVVAGGVTATVEITLSKKLVIEHDVGHIFDQSPVGVSQQAQPSFHRHGHTLRSPIRSLKPGEIHNGT